MNGNGKKISIVIPVYNTEPFIGKCLESICGQTYQNIEIICVDDGSTDQSGMICDSYRERDSRVIVVHQENAGVGRARNRGIEIASGDYIGFVDGDDWIEPEMYQKLLNAMEQDFSVGIALCNYFIGESKTAVNKRKVPPIPIEEKKFLYYIYNRDVYKGVSGYVWNRLFKREYFKGKRNFRFRDEFPIAEDVVLIAECYLYGNEKSVYIPEALYHYRQREGSFMRNKDYRLETTASCYAYDYVLSLCVKKGIDRRTINFIKRFYVYHALFLLKVAQEKKDGKKIVLLRRNIRKYWLIYCIMNVRHPLRIVEMVRLLLNT